VILLLSFPQIYEVHSWTHVMTYTPDLGTLAVLVSVLWLATGLTRAAKLLRANQAQPDGRTVAAAQQAVHPQPLAGQRA
jgi:hypothetical protein